MNHILYILFVGVIAGVIGAIGARVIRAMVQYAAKSWRDRRDFRRGVHPDVRAGRVQHGRGAVLYFVRRQRERL